MLPIALLLYDFFFIQGISAVSAKKALKWSILPIAVVVVLGLIYTDFAVVRGTYEAGVRPFSPMERLLTQGRVLFFYVSLLLYPIPSRLTLLHDIDISRTIFDPLTTFAAIVGIILCLLFTALKAKKYPLLSFAILFFILNHLVEGTVIPLELIFEHRNYIPSMFFFVPIAFGMVRCLDYFSYSRGFQVFLAGRLRTAPGLPGAHDLRAKRHCPVRCPSLARQCPEGARPQPPPHQSGKAIL